MRLLLTIVLSVIALHTINGQDPSALGGMGTFDFSSFNTNNNNNNQDTSNKLFASPTNAFGGSPSGDSANGLMDPLPINSPFPAQGTPNGAPQQMDNSIKGLQPNSMAPLPNTFGSPRPANSFGQVQNSIGQSQNPFGQSQNPFGQSQTPFGQSPNQFGRSQNQFGQPPNSVGQNQNTFGQPQFTFQQQGDSFGQSPNSIDQPQNSFGQPQRNRGDIGQQNTGFPSAQTPEERWLTVAGSQLPQNSNPTVNGNLNAGVPFNNLGFDPNNRNQFRPLNTVNQFDRRPFPNQNQMRGFPNRMPPQRGFPNQFQPPMDMSRQFENFGTPGNDEMTFNEGAIGAGPAASLDSFNPTNPANQQNQNTQEPQMNGRPPFGDGPPFGRPPMGFGGFMGPRPAMGINGFQSMGRFSGGFMGPRPMMGGPMFG